MILAALERRLDQNPRCQARIQQEMWAGSEASEDWAACSVVRDVASHYALPVQDVIDELSRLPGIGPKSAQRIAYHLLRASKQEAERLRTAITDLKERIGFCERCFNIAEGELCHI
jgi:hypothetical protein